MTITDENWTSAHYANGQKVAQITFGASPAEEDVQFNYYVTVFRAIDGDLGSEVPEELFQFSYPSLDQAINNINEKYSDWEFVDKGEASKSDGSGCSSCSAH